MSQSWKPKTYSIVASFHRCGRRLSVVESKYLTSVQQFASVAHAIKRLMEQHCQSSFQMISIVKKLSELKVQTSVTGAMLVRDKRTNEQNRRYTHCELPGCDTRWSYVYQWKQTSGKRKYAQFCAAEIKKKTELYGPQKIVQVVTDSTRNCAAARKILSVAY